MLAQFIKYVFRFLSRSLTSKFAKSAKMIKKNYFFQKCSLGTKNAEFDADFEYIEKNKKNPIRKKILTKM
jgi:hypothetical protein